MGRGHLDQTVQLQTDKHRHDNLNMRHFFKKTNNIRLYDINQYCGACWDLAKLFSISYLAYIHGYEGRLQG